MIRSERPIHRRGGANPTKFLFGFFVLLGCIYLYLVTGRPLVGIVQARRWVPTPCIINSSAVRGHHVRGGRTYRADIRYSYLGPDLRPHQSNRYSFLVGSTAGYESKARAVNRYPPGAHAICYVDPFDPSQAVLNRGFTPEMLFGLVPLAFILIGIAGLAGKIRTGARA